MASYFIAIRPAFGVCRWVLVGALLSACSTAQHAAPARDYGTADKRWTICPWTHRGDCELLNPQHAQTHALTPREGDVLAKLVALTNQNTLSDQTIVDALGVPERKAEPEDNERYWAWSDPMEGAIKPSFSLIMDRQKPVEASYYVPGKFAAVWYNPDDVASRNSSRKLVSDQADQDVRILADRFNRELAGRYPFGSAQSQDASLQTVRAFFADYASKAPTLKADMAMFKRPGMARMFSFLAQLDQAAAFLSSCLQADGAGSLMTVEPRFRMMPGSSPGSDQVINWTMSVGSQVVSYPHPTAATKLGWSCGQGVALDLQWARASAWRPVRPDGDEAHDLLTDDLSATFVATGDWALLRLIEAHRPRAQLPSSPQDDRWVILEFKVPTRHMGGQLPKAEARLYLGLRLEAQAPKTSAQQPLSWPARLLRVAPIPGEIDSPPSHRSNEQR